MAKENQNKLLINRYEARVHECAFKWRVFIYFEKLALVTEGNGNASAKSSWTKANSFTPFTIR